MICLRELSEQDSALLFEWINDRDLVSLSSTFRVVERAEHDAWFQRSG